MPQYGKTSNISRTMNIGSKATIPAANRAARVSTGADRPPVKSPSQAPRPVARTTAGVHPGSKAGLNDEKTVRLDYNDTGYANRNNQTSRNTKKRMRGPDVNLSGMQWQKSNRTFDKRLTSLNDSSISRLKRMM